MLVCRTVTFIEKSPVHKQGFAFFWGVSTTEVAGFSFTHITICSNVFFFTVFRSIANCASSSFLYTCDYKELSGQFEEKCSGFAFFST